MTKTEIKFRVEDRQNVWLNAEAKKAGVPKSKIILQLIDAAMGNDSDVIAPSNDSSIPHFELSQVIDGQQNKTYKMLWASFEGRQKLGKSEYLVSNKLGVLCEVVGKSRTNKKKLEVVATFPGDPIVFNDDGTFLAYNSDGLVQWFTESEKAKLAAEATKAIQAIAEPTADVEPVDNEIAIEVVDVPCSPTIEAVIEPSTEPSIKRPSTALTNAEFRAWLGLEDPTAFGGVCKLGASADGYLAKDGNTWFKSGNGKKAVWSTERVVTQLTLALG